MSGATCWCFDSHEWWLESECEGGGGCDNEDGPGISAACARWGVGAASACATSERTRSGRSDSGVDRRRSALAQNIGGVRPLLRDEALARALFVYGDSLRRLFSLSIS